MRAGKRPVQLGINCPKCCVCWGPVFNLDTITPGTIVMHAACSKLSHDVVWQRLMAAARRVAPPCDVCQRVFAEGQRTAETQVCEDCISSGK